MEDDGPALMRRRTLHSNRNARMGLRARLPQLGSAIGGTAVAPSRGLGVRNSQSICAPARKPVMPVRPSSWTVKAGLATIVDRREPIELQREVQIGAGGLGLLGTTLGLTVSTWFFAVPLFVGERACCLPGSPDFAAWRGCCNGRLGTKRHIRRNNLVAGEGICPHN